MVQQSDEMTVGKIEMRDSLPIHQEPLMRFLTCHPNGDASHGKGREMRQLLGAFIGFYKARIDGPIGKAVVNLVTGLDGTIRSLFERMSNGDGKLGGADLGNGTHPSPIGCINGTARSSIVRKVKLNEARMSGLNEIVTMGVSGPDVVPGYGFLCKREGGEPAEDSQERENPQGCEVHESMIILGEMS